MHGVLLDRSIVVAGGGSGIGWATVRRIAYEGARVRAVDLDPGIVRKSEGYQAISTMIGDAGQEESVASMITMAAERSGALDVVIVNAGSRGGIAGVYEQSADDWTEVTGTLAVT